MISSRAAFNIPMRKEGCVGKVSSMRVRGAQECSLECAVGSVARKRTSELERKQREEMKRTKCEV